MALVLLIQSAALHNGAAIRPPLGFSNWNRWQNRINASIFRETAAFMRESGLLAAGYEYVTLGGIGYANGSTPGGNITRNASGHLQSDPIRFPGGNEGIRKLAEELRSWGFKWGSYTEAGTAGCNGAKGSSEGYEAQDFALFFGDWRSEYLMVDSCGVVSRPPPHGPPPGYPGGQARWEMVLWKNLTLGFQKDGNPPVVLHDCHNGCGSMFAGPTLAAAPCSEKDTAQRWTLRTNGAASNLVNWREGLCAGCASQPSGGCGNMNGSVGLGMEACLVRCSQNGSADAPCAGFGTPDGLGAAAQSFNYSDGRLRNMQGGTCIELLADGVTVGGGEGGHPTGANYPPPCDRPQQQWDLLGADAEGVQLRSRARPTLCLTSAGAPVLPHLDPWCAANNNMWRVSTDVLQVWTRTMMEVESMANQGGLSKPEAWSFPDCLEVGNPGRVDPAPEPHHAPPTRLTRRPTHGPRLFCLHLGGDQVCDRTVCCHFFAAHSWQRRSCGSDAAQAARSAAQPCHALREPAVLDCT
jgi:hypothetical protein